MIFFLIAFGFIVLAFALFMKAAVQFAAIRSNERLALAVQEQTAALRQQLSPETLRELREASEQMNRTAADYIAKNMSAKSPARGMDDEWPEEIG